MPDNQSSDWQQYYPTYHFKSRDILLIEYEASAKSIESLERLYLTAINILLIVATALVSLAVGLLRVSSKNVAEVLSTQNLLLFLLLVSVFALLTTRYFADRHKSIIFDSRKIIILRRMLGLDYGAQQMVLPNWRLEGATNPFALRMFPGWFSYAAYPFWLIFLSSTSLIYALASYLLSKSANHIEQVGLHFSSSWILVLAVGFWSLWCLYIFRASLYDTHENRRLSYAMVMARILNVKLVKNIEYVIYRARLARHETRRKQVELDELIKMLQFVEDRTFFQHRGVSLKSTLRAFLGLLGLKRRSGGSTITQQLVRTLFITDLTKTVRRKLIEYPLALWFDRQIPKREQLEIYLSAVRFDDGIFGITQAIHHFFGGKLNQPLSKAKTFFLIERISNVRSLVLLDKIKHTTKQLIDAKIMNTKDVRELKSIYEKMVKSGRLLARDAEDFNTWVNKQA